MSSPQHHPERKDFQLDRLILFTDAVFAIAITLLIIDIKVPELQGTVSEGAFWNAFASMLPKFFGFLISFFMIALYWYVHHFIFGFVVNYTPKLIWLNIIFLLSIVLMPFTTALYSEYSTTEEYVKLISPFAVYVANICFTGLMNFVLLNYIFNPENKIAEHFPTDKEIKLSKMRALVIPGVFVFTLFMTWIFPGFGRLFLFTIPLAMRFFRHRIEKREQSTN